MLNSKSHLNVDKQDCGTIGILISSPWETSRGCSNSALPGRKTGASASLHEAIESLPPATSPDGESPVSETFSDLFANPVKLQYRLSSDIVEMKAAECLVQTFSDQDASWLRSSQGRGAGACLQATPSTGYYSLKSPEFKISSK